VPLSCFSLLLLLFPVYISMAVAQSAPTRNVLTRITIIQSEHGYGTAFSIDVDQREYWITAKHILTGAKHPPYGSITAKTATVRLLDSTSQQERWLTAHFSVLDAGKDVDIVVLASSAPLLQNPLPSVKTTIEGTTLGDDCEFLGFPSATGSAWPINLGDGSPYFMPFVKHCFVSSLPLPGSPVFILDGVNNPGFSGGPVIYRTGPSQQIIGVISGIVTEPAQVIPSLGGSKSVSKAKHAPKARIDANTGFIVAYTIDTALDTIRKEPIGPLRPEAH